MSTFCCHDPVQAARSFGRVYRPPGPRAKASMPERGLYLTTNALFFALASPVSLTVRTPDKGPLLAALDAARATPTIFCSFHKNVYLSLPMTRGVPRDLCPAIIAHDGRRSRVNQLCLPWMGADLFVFSWSSPASPRQQIAQFMRDTGRSIVMFTDAGGPYGVVKPGIIDLAQAADAPIRPFTAEPLRRVKKLAGHWLPLPFGEVGFRLGEPLWAPTLGQLQAALDALS